MVCSEAGWNLPLYMLNDNLDKYDSYCNCIINYTFVLYNENHFQ